jgi:capsular polysaccharide biosynthesis protein
MNEFEPGFRLSDLYGVIRRRLPLIIVAVIVGAVIASAFLISQTTQFAATSTVVVQRIGTGLILDPSTPSAGGGSSSGPSSLLEQATSDAVVREVRTQLKLKGGLDDIRQNVEVENASPSLRVDITYTAGDQRAAKEGADAFATVFLDQRRAQAERTITDARTKIEAELKTKTEDLNAAYLRLATSSPTSPAEAQARGQTEILLPAISNLNDQLNALLTVDTTPGTITQAASVPKDAAGVPTAVIVVGIVAIVALIGLGIALAWDRLDPRVTSESDIERLSPSTSVDILPLGSSINAHQRGSPRAAALNRLVFRLATPGATESPRAILLAGTGDRAPTELASELNQAFADAGARSFLVSTVPAHKKAGRNGAKVATQSLRPIIEGKVKLKDVVGNGHGPVVLCPEDAADAEATINPKSIERLLSKAKTEGFHVVLFAGPTPARHSRTVGVAREVNSVVVAADPHATRSGVRDAVAAMVDADRPPSDVVVA